MTPEQFCQWLKGVTFAVDTSPTPEQWARIREEVGKGGCADFTCEVDRATS